MEGADEARLQKEQLGRYLAWVEKEGGIEGPTHLDTWFLPEQQDRLHWLKDHCEGSVLETGCCYGYVLAFVGGNIGLDINEKSIALARVLNPKKVFVQGDIRAMPFSDGFVDTVMLVDVLEHLDWEDVARALAEAYRVARKKVLITLPNAEYITRHASVFKHRYLMSPERLQQFLDFLKQWTFKLERSYYWTLLEIWKEMTKSREEQKLTSHSFDPSFCGGHRCVRCGLSDIEAKVFPCGTPLRPIHGKDNL